jgi:hypothetical protein
MVQGRVVLAAAALVAACTQAPPKSGSESGTVSSADGVPIAYEVRGQGPTTLVFVHGWSCDRNYWRHQMDGFQGEYRVIAVDLAGHPGHFMMLEVPSAFDARLRGMLSRVSRDGVS